MTDELNANWKFIIHNGTLWAYTIGEFGEVRFYPPDGKPFMLPIVDIEKNPHATKHDVHVKKILKNVIRPYAQHPELFVKE